VVTVLAGLPAACQAPQDRPVDIRTDVDMCDYCRMAISEVRYAAELIDPGGMPRKFDEIGCMVRYARTNHPQRDFRATFVMDYESKTWVKGEEAYFVRSESIKTPMNSGIVAFRERSTAESAASRFKGRVLTYADLWNQ